MVVAAQEGVAEAVLRGGPESRVDDQHVLQEVSQGKVVAKVGLALESLVKRQHLFVVVQRLILSLRAAWPIQSASPLLDLVFRPPKIKNLPEVRALVSHVVRNGPACLFNQCQMLEIFMCREKHLPSVHLSQYACHGPHIALHVPFLAAYHY